ncbi:MAG: helix-turn-helix domain-containing protein [Janthinobacterium lividum]
MIEFAAELPDMAPARSGDVLSLVDLSLIDEARRADVWTGAAPSLFPGLSVDQIRNVETGNIRSVPMGDGALWAVRSPPATVNYAPATGRAAPRDSFSLLMQLSGTTAVSQRRRTCSLDAGDICVLDEHYPFRIEGCLASEMVFLRMPRGVVLARNPHLEHSTAVSMHRLEAGVSLLGETLSRMLLTVPLMAERQRRAVLTAMIHLLGAAGSASVEPSSAVEWRVEAALSNIELNFATPGLGAEQVARAQSISRRRLDQLLREATGVSISGQIWNRRLEQAAADLRDPTRASHTASRISLANGFEDASHFTRAFRRRYGCSPLQWRNGPAALPGRADAGLVQITSAGAGG